MLLLGELVERYMESIIFATFVWFYIISEEFKKDLCGSFVQLKLKVGGGKQGDHSRWEMIVAGTRVRLVVELLPAPSGLCNDVSFRRARPRACPYPLPSLLPLPELVLSQCCPLSGTASVGAVALGMPWVPASFYHSFLSLHRCWLLLSELYFLCPSIERGLPPAPCSWNWNFTQSPTRSVLYSVLVTLAFSGDSGFLSGSF